MDTVPSVQRYNNAKTNRILVKGLDAVALIS